MIPVLVNAIKELKAELEETKAQQVDVQMITALRAELNQMKDKIESLEAVNNELNISIAKE